MAESKVKQEPEGEDVEFAKTVERLVFSQQKIALKQANVISEGLESLTPIYRSSVYRICGTGSGECPN